MNIEQAKCKLRLHRNLTNLDETYNAFDMAIKSFEMWDKIIAELDEKIDEQYVDKYDFCYQQGIEFALELIKKYKKEIEE